MLQTTLSVSLKVCGAQTADARLHICNSRTHVIVLVVVCWWCRTPEEWRVNVLVMGMRDSATLNNTSLHISTLTPHHKTHIHRGYIAHMCVVACLLHIISKMYPCMSAASSPPVTIWVTRRPDLWQHHHHRRRCSPQLQFRGCVNFSLCNNCAVPHHRRHVVTQFLPNYSRCLCHTNK